VTVAVVTPCGAVQSAAAPVSVKVTVHWLAPPAVHDGKPASADAVPAPAISAVAHISSPDIIAAIRRGAAARAAVAAW
jgi:hypothetical protein